jgi:glycosyltransferase involved in cell wall biosynthesis
VGPSEPDGTLDEIRRLARPVQDRVHVLAHGVWGRDRASLFADADVFLLPSATENFGTAAAEAAAVGLPFSSADRCGVAEWPTPWVSSRRPYGDIARLRSALINLAQPAVRSHACTAAADVRSRLSWKRLAADQHELYAAVAHGSAVAS